MSKSKWVDAGIFEVEDVVLFVDVFIVNFVNFLA